MTHCYPGSREQAGQTRKLNVLNSVSERVARGRNEKLEEDLISTYAALEHNKGTYPTAVRGPCT